MPTGSLVRLDIRVDPASWQNTFDVLEVWRSRMTEDGPFDELTAADYAPARVPASGGDRPVFFESGPLVNLVGLSLDLLVDEVKPLSFVFTGVNPLTFSNAAAQIAFGGQNLLQSWVVNGRLVLETVRTGVGASLRVVGGDAAPLLRLATEEPLCLATGCAARIPLVPGVERYSFDDPNGREHYTYTTRFRNRGTGVVSALSRPVTHAAGVDPANVVRGWLRLADTSGRPLGSTRVLVDNAFKGTMAMGQFGEPFLVAGGAQAALTNDRGYVEFLLVRGLQLTVSIGGTSLFRDVVVPTDPAVTSFNLMDPTLSTDDLFSVQVPALDYMARRSLGG